MGGADAAGGEDIVVARPAFVDRGDDLRLDIGDDAGLAQSYAELGQLLRDIAEVHILGAAGENLIADDQHRGGDDIFFLFRRHQLAPGARG